MKGQERYEILIENARKSMKTADHLLYMTYPLIQENRLFIKIFELVCEAIKDSVQALLQYEYMWKRLQLSGSFTVDFETIRQRHTKYGLTNKELTTADEIFKLSERHKKSPIEFVRKERFVIMTDNLRVSEINLRKLKEYIYKTRSIIEKVEKRVLSVRNF